MGVKDLWNIVAPLSERRPLYELNGKAVAIDLSGWVVDSQTITDNHAQPKMYLRNLFFRTSFMLQQNIFPVFVLEGTAPSLKHKTIAKRNELRSETQDKTNSRKGTRSQFNAILKQCEEMLNYIGLFCLRGSGEAEAMCAYLDQDGLVDGCISQDSDCFLYGAKKVYRNFCTKSQGNRATSQGSVDVYTMEKIEQVLQLGRNKMIALALLCGCDYDNGVTGIGKEAALKLFKTIKDEDILDRLKSWKTEYWKYEKLEKELSDPNICTNCGHEGKVRSHTKKGCVDCGTDEKCNDTFKEKRNIISNELTMRKKALAMENFPNQEVIDEFLIRKDKELFNLSLDWRQPKVHKFIEFMNRHLGWENDYGFAKIFPLMTQWQLHNLPQLSLEEQQSLHVVVPKRIRKIRRRKGILCYEIVWKDEDHYLDGLMLTYTSDKENDEDNVDFEKNELVSIEIQDAFTKCYPEMAEEFEEARKPKKKTNRKRKAKITENNRKIDDFVTRNPVKLLEKSMGNICITPKITPKRKKKVINSSSSVKNPQICRVLEIEKQESILNGSLDRMFNEITPEDFESDGEANMSLIVKQICGFNEKCNSSVTEIIIKYSDSESELERDNFEKNKDQFNKGSDMCKEVSEDIDDDDRDYYDNDLMLETISKICRVNKELIDNENDVLMDDKVERSIRKNENIVEEIDLTIDEFDMDEAYVPLRERIKHANIEKRLTIGIDSLLNTTEEDD